MNTIKRELVKNEMDYLKEIKRDDNFYNKLEELGYTLTTLSSSSKCFLLEKDIKEMEIKTKKYLNGKYIVVGATPEYYQGYKYLKSKGYVKEIEE